MEEIGLPHWPQVRSDNAPAPLLTNRLHAALSRHMIYVQMYSNPGIRFKLELVNPGSFDGPGAHWMLDDGGIF